jgi:hypothetical protein
MGHGLWSRAAPRAWRHPFAHKLAGVGINPVLVARRSEPLEKIGQEVRARSRVEVRTLSLDLKRSDMLDPIRAVTDDIEVGLLIFAAPHRSSPMCRS